MGAVIHVWNLRWLWRLTVHTWHFRARATAGVILYVPGRWDPSRDFTPFLERVESELEELSRQFGFRLRGRVAVFLFPNWRKIPRIVRGEHAGYALSLADAILLAADTNLTELMRHELAHLYAARWKQAAPRLLSEGLATWWQGKWGGRSVDTLAEAILTRRSVPLRSLLKEKGFHSASCQDDYYLLAGGFTGFLIRRFGWESYRKLYRRADHFNFKSKFKKILGVSLEKAESLWRYEKLAQELMARRLKTV